VSILDEVFGRGSCERIAKLLKVDEVFTRQALIDGFVLGVRIGSVVRTCKVNAVDLFRYRSQSGGSTGFLENLLNDLARACIEQVEQKRTPVFTLGSDEPVFAPIVSSVDMYRQYIDGFTQGVMAQLAVPADLMNSSTPSGAARQDLRLLDPSLGERDEPRKNRFERISEEMMMDEKS
jgi:hypothetical protein